MDTFKKNRKKLIVNTGTLSAGGAERVLSVLSTPLADAFDEVQYVMWLDAKYPDIFYEIDPRVKIIRISQRCGSTSVLRHILWFRNYVKKEEPNLVLSFMVMVCFTVTISLLFTGIKQVVAERNDPRHFKRKWIRKLIDLLYYTSDIKGILMQTEWNKAYFLNKELYDKTSTIYNPVNMRTSCVAAALNADKKDLIVSVGRLTSQKQQTTLLDAFSEFYKTHPSYQLIIYGEGEERKNLKEYAEKLGLSSCFHLPGRSRNVLNDILPAKIFVMSSKYEGMSNALLEAMCIGLPCISTKVSGATDLIVNEENGFLVDIDDSRGISLILNRLADNVELRNRIGKKASEVYDIINSKEVSRKWVTYLCNIMNKQ